jgi:hypothetical protein
MLIINAPGFFSLFWGLIKKFIDPRTAQRIQVFSNTEKGLAALRQLVPVEEIPVDYGGTFKSVRQAFLEEAADPLLKKQDIELLQVKRKGKTSAKTEWTLEANEYMEIRVYTRSVSTATVTVEFNGDVYAQQTAKCKWENCSSSGGGGGTPTNGGSTSGSATPFPKCNVIVEALHGPGTVRVDILDLDNADKKVGAAASRGYFLLVCDIKAAASTATN